MKGNGDSKGSIMRDQAADFTGSIPAFYDQALGPIFFADFADDIARRVADSAPTRVLERRRAPASLRAVCAICCRERRS